MNKPPHAADAPRTAVAPAPSAPAIWPEPQIGGRYIRDPVTGELDLVFRTEPAQPRQRPLSITEQPSKE